MEMLLGDTFFYFVTDQFSKFCGFCFSQFIYDLCDLN